MSDINDLPEEQDEDENETTPAAATGDGPVAPTPGKVNPVLAQYLMSKQAMSQAQSTQNENMLYANLARAGGELTAGIPGAKAYDDSDYDGLDAQAALPVKQLTAQNAAAIQSTKDQSDLQKAVNQNQLNDASSPQSQTVQALVSKLYPGKFTPDQLSTITAADQSLIIKPLELESKIRQASQDKQDARDQKATDAQMKANTMLRTGLETFRGNQAVQQAGKDVLSAKKALEIVQGKNPDDLTTQDLAILATEMAKVSSGGVPTEGGIKHLMPDNLQTKLAEIQNFLTSKPTNADAGAYITKNMAYLKDMQNVAQGTLSSFRKNILKGYKGRVSDDMYQSAIDDYGLGGDEPAQNNSQPQSSKPNTGAAAKAPHGGKYPPGSQVKIKGTLYTVGADGNSLLE